MSDNSHPFDKVARRRVEPIGGSFIGSYAILTSFSVNGRRLCWPTAVCDTVSSPFSTPGAPSRPLTSSSSCWCHVAGLFETRSHSHHSKTSTQQSTALTKPSIATRRPHLRFVWPMKTALSLSLSLSLFPRERSVAIGR